MRHLYIAGVIAFLVAAQLLGRASIVFGPEDPREIVVSTEYPFSAVGRLQRSPQSYCTAALITDRHILTAARCFVVERDHNFAATKLVDLSEVEFLPNFVENAIRESEVRGIAEIVEFGSFDLRSEDWAIALLDQPVDTERYGVMQVEPAIDLLELEDTEAWLGAGLLSHIAYSGVPPSAGASPVLDSGCSVRLYISQGVADSIGKNLFSLWRDKVTMFVHDCSATVGQSGGPIFLMRNGIAFIVGIHTLEDVPKEYALTRTTEMIRSKEFDFAYMNYAVSHEGFGKSVRALVERQSESSSTLIRPSSWGRIKNSQ